MADLLDVVTEAIRTVLAENGASSPTQDTDTLARLAAGRAISATKEHAAGQVDPAAELANVPVPEVEEPPALS